MTFDLSIVTITKDYDAGLSRTLHSIVAVSERSQIQIQVIIIDGGNGSLSVNWHQNKNNKLEKTLIKEQDSGIFQAMNKGWREASAPWVIFMNSGDSFVSTLCLDSIIEKLNSSKALWAIGDSLLESPEGRISVWRPQEVRLFKLRLGFNSYPHQSTFYSKSRILELELFREKSKVADWETSIRLRKIEPPLYLETITSFNECFHDSRLINRGIWAREISSSRQHTQCLLFGSTMLDYSIQRCLGFIRFSRLSPYNFLKKIRQ